MHSVNSGGSHIVQIMPFSRPWGPAGMVWLLALLVITAFGVVISFETTQKQWNTKTVGHLPENADLNTLAVSPIECVLIAMTHNRSTAAYDMLSQQCFLFRQETINQISMNNNEMHVINEHVPIGDIKTCEDVAPASISGVYRITPVPEESFDVFCDMASEGGPWTIMQNRQSNEVDFFDRNWDQYKTGFGDLRGSFWLGNEHMFVLTRTPCILRIQLESLNGTFGYAEYSTFQISNEANGYKLSVDGFSGNISDAFIKSNGAKFTTPDRDNDKDDTRNCAEARGGSWWHKQCTRANLNGMYEYDPLHFRLSMYWIGFYGQEMQVPLKTSRMSLKKP